MNQKDYKAIAKIMKNHHQTDLWDGRTYTVNKNNQKIINDLADYFEKEEPTETQGRHGIIKLKKLFNRKQFLKDCGV